jgi:ABC-2 type transport system permease protein
LHGPLITLTISSLKGYVRNRSAMFFSLVVPLMIMGIFGLLNLGGNFQLQVGVVDQAQNAASAALISNLREVSALKVRIGEAEAERRAVEKGQRDLVVILPPSLGQGPSTILAYYNQTRPQESQAALAIMNRFVDQASLRVAGVQPAFSLQAEPVKGRKVTYVDFLVPGIIAMSAMQTGLFSVAFAFVQLKQKGILRRLMATPMRVTDFLFAQVTTRLMMAALQTAVLLAVGLVLFHFHLAGNVPEVLLLGILGAAIFIAIGFAISGISKNEETAAPLANLISLPMLFLSGVFFPRGTMPGWLQGITQYLPLTYVLDALRAVAVEGVSLWSVRADLLGIAVWMVLSVFLATRLFRWETA